MHSVDSNSATIFTVTTVTLTVVMKNYQSAVSCSPDKEVALTFVFLLGYYPLVKPKFEHIRPALLRGLCKLLLCNGGILLMYGLVLLLIPGGSISQEMRTTALAVSLTTLAMGNVAFLLYDRALHNMLQAYRILWQPRLHKMLGR